MNRLKRNRAGAFINFTEKVLPYAASAMSGRYGRGRNRARDRAAVSGCLTYRSKNYGRKISRAALRRRLVDYNSTSNIYRIYGIRKDAGTPAHELLNSSGTYTLKNCQSAAGTTLSWPLWLFDITSCPNNYNGAYTLPRTAWAVNSATEVSGAAVNFIHLNSPITAGSFDTEQNGITKVPGERSLLDWVDAKFMFYAPLKIPVKICIDIVQFKNDAVMPGGQYGISPFTMSNAAEVAFWESMMKRFMVSPLETGNRNLENKYIKYLHRDSFTLDCKTTVENEVTHYKQYDLFKRMNRKCSYKWLDPGTMNMVMPTGGGTEATDWITNKASPNYWTVMPQARIFLMVRAYAGYVGTSTNMDFNYHPSFDLILKTKHTTLSP